MASERLKLVREFEIDVGWFGKEEEYVKDWILKVLSAIRLAKVEVEAIVDNGNKETVIVRVTVPKRYKLFVIVVDKGTWKAKVYASKWFPINNIVYIYQQA